VNREYDIASQVGAGVYRGLVLASTLPNAVLVHYSEKNIDQIYTSPPDYFPRTHISQVKDHTFPETIIASNDYISWLNRRLDRASSC